MFFHDCWLPLFWSLKVILWWSMDRLDFSVCLFSKPLSKQLSIVKMTKLPADTYKIGIKWQTMLKALILALTKHCQFKIIKKCSSYMKTKQSNSRWENITQYRFWYWHQIAFDVNKVLASSYKNSLLEAQNCHSR